MSRQLAMLPLLIGCQRPLLAPTELDDLCGYMYTHVQDDDPDALAEGAENLAVWLAAHPGETAEGFEIHDLDEPTVDALDGTDRTAIGLVGGTVTTISPVPVARLAEPLVTADQTLVYPNTYVSFERTFTSDGACFVDSACDAVEFENESVGNYPLGITIGTETTGQFRWVETPELGTVLVTRAWLHDPATVNVDFLKVDAQYFLTVTFDDGDGAVRLQAVWADVRIVGVDVPDGTALNLLIDSFQEADEDLYAYAAE